MFDPKELTGEESLMVIVLSVIMLAIIISQLFSKSIYGFCSPLTILGLTIFYYSIAGPVVSIWNGNTVFRSIEHRPYYMISWFGTLVYVLLFLLGYASVSTSTLQKNRYLPTQFNLKVFKEQVYTCYVIGVVCLVLLSGPSVISGLAFWRKNTSPDSEPIYDGGGFAGYIQNGFDFLIVACPGLVYLYRKKQISALTAGGLLFVAFAFFISTGFRWRLVIAALCCLAMWYNGVQKKVKLVPLAIGGFGFLLLMGIMEISRSYGKGLDLSRTENKGISGYLQSAFTETAVFQASGFVMESENNGIIPNINLDPLIQSIVTPIPRIFWPNKPTGNYLVHLKTVYGQRNKANGIGQAIMNYGEYYMMFGWLGVGAMAFLFGMFYGRINKPLINSKTGAELHPWYIIFCLLNAAYLYVVISRGYTPQQTMFYFFTVYPAWYYFRKTRRVV